MVESACVIQYFFEITIAADPLSVWAALTVEASQWWPKDFYSSPHTKTFVVEPVLGGRVYEDHGDGGGLIWYTVLGIEKGKSLTLSGQLAPPYGGPASGILKIELIQKDTRTLLKVSDYLYGRVDERMENSLGKGWRQLLTHGLKEYVESKEAIPVKKKKVARAKKSPL